MRYHHSAFGILASLLLLIGQVSPRVYGGASPAPHAASPGASQPALQFSSGASILGFAADGVYVASAAYALHESFIGANWVDPRTPVRPRTIDQSQTTDQPQAADPAQANEHLQPLDQVTWTNLWDGVDLTYRSASGSLAESVYTLAPGSSTASIRLHYNLPARLNQDGSLALGSGRAQMTESAPSAYQDTPGGRLPVSIAFRVLPGEPGGDAEVGFVAGNYDPALPLVIDPRLSANAFIGSGGDDLTQAVAADSAGNIYVTGLSCLGWNNPVRAFTPSWDDAFVEKMDANGAIQWVTFLGGGGEDAGYGIAFDGAGNVYVTGSSSGTWGSTPKNSYTGGADIMVVKLNPSGAILWNTFLGGVNDDAGRAIYSDPSGNLTIAGETTAGLWGSPTNGVGGYRDGFVARLNTSGVLQWNTYLGGSSSDFAEAVAVDGSGAIFAAGYSQGTWGAPKRDFSGGNSDGFAVKLNKDGGILWNTFLGGTGEDTGAGITVDASGSAYVTGVTYNDSWGLPAVHYHDWMDGYIAKIDASGNLVWNTFVGGDSGDYTVAIALDPSASIVYVAGYSGANWGTPVRYYTKWEDGFLAQYSAATGAFITNSFVGGEANDEVTAMAIAPNFRVIVAGYTTGSFGSPVTGYSGGYEGFVAQLSIYGVMVWNTFQGGVQNEIAQSIYVDDIMDMFVVGYANGPWMFPVRPYSGRNDAFVVKFDPTGKYLWNTFLGGSGNDYASSVVIGYNLNLFVVGNSSATWGGPLNAYSGGSDVFLARLDNNNGSLQWNTFLGGAGNDSATGLTRDTSANLIVTGFSSATWGASPRRAFSGPGSDAFAAKLDANGGQVWNTFLGGAGTDVGKAITADGNAIYVAGSSTQTWYTPVSGFISSPTNGFAAALNNNGGLLWNTFIGGTGSDAADGLALKDGVLYVAGNTTVTWGAPRRAYSGGQDAFVQALDAGSGADNWHTFLGGPGYDYASGISVDQDGTLVVSGGSAATWGSPGRMSFAGDNAGFVAALDPDGQLLWNAFLGEGGDVYTTGVASSYWNRKIFVTGFCDAHWGPSGGMMTYNGGGGIDAFAAAIDPGRALYAPMLRK